METYLTLSEAGQLAQVSAEVLKQLAQCGKLNAVMLSSGEILVKKSDIEPPVPIQERPEYADFAHLQGQPISLSEASRQYDVPHQTISRWVAKGMIDRLGQDGRAVLIDHAQVAALAKIYHQSEGHQGKWVFKKGQPYSKKS